MNKKVMKPNKTKNVRASTQGKYTQKSKKSAARELANYCMHALALFTNAVITERTKDYVRANIPATIVVGRKKSKGIITVTFMLNLFGAPVSENWTIQKLGESLFMWICHTQDWHSPEGKPLSDLKKYEVITEYGDKCIVKDGTFTFVPAKAPKAKKK